MRVIGTFMAYTAAVAGLTAMAVSFTLERERHQNQNDIAVDALEVQAGVFADLLHEKLARVMDAAEHRALQADAHSTPSSGQTLGIAVVDAHPTLRVRWSDNLAAADALQAVKELGLSAKLNGAEIQLKSLGQRRVLAVRRLKPAASERGGQAALVAELAPGGVGYALRSLMGTQRSAQVQAAASGEVVFRSPLWEQVESPVRAQAHVPESNLFLLLEAPQNEAELGRSGAGPFHHAALIAGLALLGLALGGAWARSWRREFLCLEKLLDQLASPLGGSLSGGGQSMPPRPKLSEFAALFDRMSAAVAQFRLAVAQAPAERVTRTKAFSQVSLNFNYKIKDHLLSILAKASLLQGKVASWSAPEAREARTHIKEIESEARAAKKELDEFNFRAGGEAGGARQPIYLAAIVDRALKAKRAALQSARIAVERQFIPAPRVRVNESTVQSAVESLIDHLIETLSGSNERHLKVRVEPVGSQVCLSLHHDNPNRAMLGEAGSLELSLARSAFIAECGEFREPAATGTASCGHWQVGFLADGTIPGPAPLAPAPSTGQGPSQEVTP